MSIRLRRSPDAIVARRRSLGISPRRPAPWTPREEALLRVAAAAGVPAPALARSLGRSPEQVRARRRELVGRTRPPGRPYHPDEDDAIRGSVGWNGDLIALADRLGRTPDALRLRARALGVYDPPRRHRWAEWEDAVVRDGYTSGLPCSEIARQLSHRGPASVAARARRLGLVSYARRWSTQDERRLMQLTVTGSTIEDAAQKLNRTPEAVRRRAARLGITPPTRAWAPRDGRRWTAAEDELLRLHHALNPARLAELLGRSDVAVCRRLRALGLRAAAARSPHHPVSRRNGAGGQPARLEAGPAGVSRRFSAAGPRGRPRA